MKPEIHIELTRKGLRNLQDLQSRLGLEGNDFGPLFRKAMSLLDCIATEQQNGCEVFIKNTFGEVSRLPNLTNTRN